MRILVTVLLTLTVAISVALLFALVVVPKCDRKKSVESFDDAGTITSRMCAVRTSDGARFEFSDPDMPAVRSVPGGVAGQCYFLRSPEDAEDPECTLPGRWGVGGQGGKGDLVKFGRGFVNGADRCLFDVTAGRPRESYANLQSEMRDEYAGLGGAPAKAALAAEQAEGRRLRGFLSGTADYDRQKRAKLCHAVATVAPGRWTAEDMSAAASLIQEATTPSRPLHRALTGDATFLRDAADRVCRGERDPCYILRPSFDAGAPVSSDEARRDARWLAAVIAGAYPAPTATDAELGGIATRVCANSNGSSRCEVLRSDWKAVSDKHWSRWGAAEREAATDLVRSLAGIDASHLSDAELSSLSKRVCALGSAEFGIGGVAPGDAAPPCAALSRVLSQKWDARAVKDTPVLRWTPEDRALATETVRIVGGRQFGKMDDRSQIADALRRSC